VVAAAAAGAPGSVRALSLQQLIGCFKVVIRHQKHINMISK